MRIKYSMETFDRGFDLYIYIYGQYLAFISQNWDGFQTPKSMNRFVYSLQKTSKMSMPWWVFWYNNDNDNDNDGTCSKVLDFIGFALTKMCTRS